MSDLQDRRSMPDSMGAGIAPFVIGCTHDDRDWAEWIASHLEGLGYSYEFAQPLLPAGPAALTQVADWRSAGVDLIVIASDALLHGVPEHLQLEHLGDGATPLIVVLIEDVDLPRDWDDAIQARMFEAPDDYHASRDMLLRALEQARPQPFAVDESADAVAATAAARRDPFPAPLVVVDPFPVPEPAVELELDAPAHVANGTPREAGLLELPGTESIKPAALSGPGVEARNGTPQVIDLSADAPALGATPLAGGFGVPSAPPVDPVPVSPWGTAPDAPAAWAAPTDPPAPWAPPAEAPAAWAAPASPPPGTPPAWPAPAGAPTADASDPGFAPLAPPPAAWPANGAPEAPSIDAASPTGADPSPLADLAAPFPLPTVPDATPEALDGVDGADPVGAADAAAMPDVGAVADAGNRADAAPQALAQPASPAPVEPLAPPAPAAWASPAADAPADGTTADDTEGDGTEAGTAFAEPVPLAPLAPLAEAMALAPAPPAAEPSLERPSDDAPSSAIAAGAEAAAPPADAATPTGAVAEADRGEGDDLPAPAARPRSGLLGMGAASSWAGARSGGASVTETEQQGDDADRPGAPAEPSDGPRAEHGDAGEEAVDAADHAAATDAGTATASAEMATAGPAAAPEVPAGATGLDDDVADDAAAAAVADQVAPEVAAGAEPEPAADLGGARIVRLPLEPVESLWSIEGAVELLAKGLRHRCAEPTPSAAGQFGLTAPLDAPGGVVVALTGPAGVGKSTIALTHAHRRRGDVDVLWWVRGGSTEMLRADLRALAVAVGVEGTDAASLIDALRHWLATTEDRWLLIIDDLATDVSLDGLLPDHGRGHVVLTTRHAPEGLDAVTISSPSPAAARRALFEHLSACGRELEPFDGEALDRLAATLAEAPWAVAVAAAQLGERGVSPGRLAAQLTRPPAVEALPGAVAEHPVDAVLLVALEGVADASPVAAEALVATTALADTPMLRSDLDRLGGPRVDVTDLGRTYRLVQAGPDHAAPVGAVTDALRRLIDDGAARNAARSAVRALDAALPTVASATVSDLYAPHAAAAVAAAARLGVANPALARLERAVADWARRLHGGAAPATAPLPAPPAPPAPPAAESARNGHLVDGDVTIPAPPPPPAPPLAEVAPATASAGPVGAPRADATDVPELISLRDRSVDAAERGAYHEAIRLLEELVQRSEAAYGVDELRTLSARNDLANALIAAGSQHRAHQLLVRVLDDTTRVYGEEHAATLLAKHNLANSHADLGRHAEALTLREQVLAAREIALGTEHPQTVSARSNLANSLAALGRAQEAMSLRELVADVRLRTLGLGSPQTMGALNNLANSYADVGRHEDALRLRQQVLDGREQLLGAEHPHTITARNNLANSLAALGRYDDARAARERTLADCERVLGPDHPHTITARANLAFSAPGMASSPVFAPPAASGPQAAYGANGLPGTNGAYGAAPGPYGNVGTLQPVEVDVEVPPAQPGAYPLQGAPLAAPAKKKRRFWFFGRR